jgi:hypothetical protein
MRLTYSLSVCLSFQLLNQLMDPHEIWNECYTIGIHQASYTSISSQSRICEVVATLAAILNAQVMCSNMSRKCRPIC